MWKKLSTGTGVTNICIAVNDWILFSLIYLREGKSSETVIIVFNHTVFERDTY